MADETIAIRVKMIGGEAVVTEAKAVSGAVSGVGSSTAKTAKSTAASSKSVAALKKGYGAFTRVAKYSTIPVIGGLIYETSRSVNAFRDQRKATLETQARLKSMGNVAGVTADEVAQLSGKLAMHTGVQDEEIQSTANMLLSFGAIRNEVGKNNDVFNQATEATLDLAAASKTDLVSAAKQVGKALNDPATGLTALRRSGASFNAEQTETIQKLFASGKRLKAQKMILKELSSEFAGTARSQHDSVDRLGQAWGELEETLGKAVFPILQDVTKWMTRTINEAQRGKGPIQDIKNAFAAFGDEIQRVKDNLSALKNIFDSITGSTFEDAIRDAQDVPGVNLTGTPGGATSPDPISGGGHHGGTANTGNEPGHPRRVQPVAPKTETANGGHRRGGSVIVKFVTPAGKVLAEGAVDEAEIAAAWS